MSYVRIGILCFPSLLKNFCLALIVYVQPKIVRKINQKRKEKKKHFSERMQYPMGNFMQLFWMIL